ncbi:MAG: hypothetical protein ACR2IE_02210 [Candidatus Sumerlaeaceae bacterium]
MRRTPVESTNVKASALTPFQRGMLLMVLFVCVGIWHGYGLNQRGLLEHDEGHNLLAARTYSDVIRWMAHGGPWQSSTAELAKLKQTLHRQGGTLYPAGKPGYIVGLAIASFAVGLTGKAALWLAWVAGMVIVVFGGIITRQLYGRALLPQVISVVGIGLSPLLGYLSREVGGTIWSLAFGSAGFAMLLSVDDKKRWAGACALLAGVLFGYGFTCHYNLLPGIAAAFAADYLFARNNLAITQPSIGAAVRSRIRAWLFTFLGIALVLATFQLGSMAAEHKLRPIYPKYQNYFAELMQIVGVYQLPALRGDEVGEGARGWGYDAVAYAGRVAGREGIGIWLGHIVAVAMTLQFWSRRRIAPAGVFFLLLLGFWALHPWKVERSWGMLIVAAWLLVAGAISAMQQITQVNQRPRMLAVLTTAVLLLQAAHVTRSGWLHLWQARSPISGAVASTLDYVRENGGTINANSAARSFAPLWKWSIVETGRQAQYRPALKRVDFSSFEKPQIVFTDPNTWNDPQFAVSREELAATKLVARHTCQNPHWTVAAYDLRTTGGL